MKILSIDWANYLKTYPAHYNKDFIVLIFSKYENGKLRIIRSKKVDYKDIGDPDVFKEILIERYKPDQLMEL